MNINKILNELRSEKEEVERAITALERIGGKRRGRPPEMDEGSGRSGAKEEAIQESPGLILAGSLPEQSQCATAGDALADSCLR